MKPKMARRFLTKNHWNLSPSKLENFTDAKIKNLLKTKKKALKVLERK